MEVLEVDIHVTFWGRGQPQTQADKAGLEYAMSCGYDNCNSGCARRSRYGG